ncbi:MAG: hypothetical protein MUE42_09720 [Opitutaceae bacterium]|nr:hypothetical protein [Opitutaceae bacterium]
MALADDVAGALAQTEGHDRDADLGVEGDEVEVGAGNLGDEAQAGGAARLLRREETFARGAGEGFDATPEIDLPGRHGEARAPRVGDDIVARRHRGGAAVAS